MKRFISLLLVLAVCVCIPLDAYAHDVPQDRTDCSIELLVRYEGEDVTGGTLTAVKIGYVDEDDGNYFFSQEITGEFIEDISSPEAAAAMKEFYEENKDTYEFYTQTQSVKNGKATMTDMPTGLYLVYQQWAANGYRRLKPVLVSIPYMQDGQYQYHLTANIKAELEREPVPYNPPPTEPPDPELPQTGQLNWPIPVLVMVGLILFLVGWKLVFEKRKERNET